MAQTKSNKGFTIIEIMLAMAFFGFVLALAMGGYLQVIKNYRKGVISQRTQQSGRVILDDISQTARRAKVLAYVPDSTNEINYLCLDDTQYAHSYNSAVQTLVVYSGNTCGNVAGLTPVRTLNQDQTLVNEFEVEIKTDNPIDNVPIGFNLSLYVTSDSRDLFDATGKECDPTKPGSQYCANNRFETSFALRDN